MPVNHSICKLSRIWPRISTYSDENASRGASHFADFKEQSTSGKKLIDRYLVAFSQPLSGQVKCATNLTTHSFLSALAFCFREPWSRRIRKPAPDALSGAGSFETVYALTKLPLCASSKDPHQRACRHPLTCSGGGRHGRSCCLGLRHPLSGPLQRASYTYNERYV
jgi:hypothetical protein